jgi:hypothetical protein
MNDRREQQLLKFASFYSKRLQIQASLAPQRLADFNVSVDSRYQCPKCWIYDGRQVGLEQITSTSPREETFECERCGSFSFPVLTEPDGDIPDRPL